MMWGTWLFWIFVGGLVLFMCSRGGCCGHAGHGAPRNGGGQGGPGKENNGGDTAREQGHGGCH